MDPEEVIMYTYALVQQMNAKLDALIRNYIGTPGTGAPGPPGPPGVVPANNGENNAENNSENNAENNSENNAENNSENNSENNAENNSENNTTEGGRRVRTRKVLKKGRRTQKRR